MNADEISVVAAAVPAAAGPRKNNCTAAGTAAAT